MAVGGINKWTPLRNFASKHRIQPECEGQAEPDAGRDGQTSLAGSNSQTQTGTEKKKLSFSADHEQDW